MFNDILDLDNHFLFCLCTSLCLQLVAVFTLTYTLTSFRVTRRYFGIPCGSASIERESSAVSQVITQYRSAVEPCTFDNILFLHSYVVVIFSIPKGSSPSEQSERLHQEKGNTKRMCQANDEWIPFLVRSEDIDKQ